MGRRIKRPKADEHGIRVYDEHPKTGEVMTPGYTYESGRSDKIEVYDALGKAAPLVPMRTDLPDEALRKYRDIDGMRRFTDREKDVMILCVGLNMSDEDAAEYLGVTVDAVKSAKKTARKKCDGTF